LSCPLLPSLHSSVKDYYDISKRRPFYGIGHCHLAIAEEIEKARIHVEAGVNASRLWPFETILISMLLEQEKALVELRSKIEAQEKISDR